MSVEDRIIAVNDKILAEGDCPEVGFEFQDTWVTNPYIDGRTNIENPTAHYGQAYLNSLFVKDCEIGLRIAIKQCG